MAKGKKRSRKRDVAPSNDATLKALSASAGSVVPGVYPGRTSHAIVLPHSVESISITPTATHPGASVLVDGRPVESGHATEPRRLEVGRNLMRVEVIAQDGKTRNTQVVKAIRACRTPDWTKVAEASPWAPRDSAGELVFDGRMWLFGGYTPEVISDTWCSADGVNWEQMGAVPTPGVNIPVAFAHDGRMWITGTDGRLFSSKDGRRWKFVTDKAPWMGRGGAGSAVFNGRMWVVGGCGSDLYNDVWSSADGVRWKLELEEAPWPRRQVFSNLVVHNDMLWLVGGGICVYEPFRGYRDVWCSPDGREWTKTTDEAPWLGRIWTSCAVYRNRIWLIGGFRAQPTWNNFNDLWYSADGANWKLLVTEHIWEPRHEVSAYVHDDKLWVVGGNAWPLKTDAWSLLITGLTFVSQPVVEEFVHAQYSYTAQADFGAGNARYRLVDGPPWLKIDRKSGLIRGTPPSTGDFPVVVEAHDDAGATVRQAYTLHVIRTG